LILKCTNERNVLFIGIASRARRRERSLMALSLSREFVLVAACSVWPPSDRRINAIHEAVAGPLDWDRFLRIVMRHRVPGLVHDGLTRTPIAVPPEIAREIGVQAAALVRQNLTFAAEAVRLQRLFAEANLPVGFIKGVSLAMLAYGNLGIRHNRDIDLLVAPELTLAASVLLERAGYRQFEPPATFGEAQLLMWRHRCKEVRYVHEKTQLEVELHSRLFDNPRLMAEVPITGSLRTIPISKDIGLCTLGEDDLFSYLCAHGAVHCWFRLKWLADIGALLAHQPVGGVERLYRATDARGAGRSAAQAILLCRRLLGTTIPDQLITTLRKQVSVRWLDTIAMKAITADLEPTEQLFGTTRNSLSHFLLARDWRYWLAELKHHLISPVDILTLPLPKQLQVLYPMLRLPLWLLRHSIRRGGTS
jgi:Uncharacterised nucleotidyltransferase